MASKMELRSGSVCPMAQPTDPSLRLVDPLAQMMVPHSQKVHRNELIWKTEHAQLSKRDARQLLTYTTLAYTPEDRTPAEWHNLHAGHCRWHRRWRSVCDR